MSALGNRFGWSGSGSSGNGSNSNGGADSSSSLGGFLSGSAGISGRLLAGSLSSLSGSSSGSGVSKANSFNIRFLIKPKSENEDEENDLNEDDDQLEFESEFGTLASSSLFKSEKSSSSEPNYEKMQLSAALFPAPDQGSSSSESDNYLVCVARRIPVADNSPSNIGVEQFSTKLDLAGNIISIDTSGVSSTYSQYLNKDLVDTCFLELCLPTDLPKLHAHLKEAISKGGSTISSLYRLRIASDKYVLVQTKSKRFTCGGTKQNYISAHHSIIRDSESTSITTTTSSNPVSSIANSVTDPVTVSESTIPREVVTTTHPSPHPVSSTSTSSISTSTTSTSTSISTSISTTSTSTSTSVSTSTTSTSTSTSISTSASTSASTSTTFSTSISTSTTSTASASASASTTSTSSSSSLSSSSSASPYPTFAPLSPSTTVVSAEYILSDCLGLSEMFPASSWSDYETTTDPGISGSVVDDNSNDVNTNSNNIEASGGERMSQATATVSSLQSPQNYTLASTPGSSTSSTSGRRQRNKLFYSYFLFQLINLIYIPNERAHI